MVKRILLKNSTKKNAIVITEYEAQRIGQDLGITFKIFSPAQLAKGINHENAEHGDITYGDPVVAARIARPHLEENPEYYDDLDKMEKKPMKNANQLPKRYFARAMEPGVCKYDKEMVMLTNATLAKMAPSSEGNPIYVEHVDKVNLGKMELEAVGFVVKQFFNSADGAFWDEILITSDKGHEEVRKGCKVSTAYVPTESGNSGTLHNVKYDREITNGYYEHLALTHTPRYENAIIMTPEEFAEYNAEKTQELESLKNSKIDKGGKRMKLNFFKKTKVENTDELLNSIVETEEGVEVPLKDAIAEYVKANSKTSTKIDEKTIIDVGGEKMELGSFLKKYNAMKNTDDEDEDDMHNEDDEEGDGKEDKTNKKKNKSKKNEGDEDEDDKEDKTNKKKNSKPSKEELERFEALKNARGGNADEEVIESSKDQVARGIEMFG